MGALTGDARALVVPMYQASQLAVRQFNAQHPGRTVDVVGFDSQGDPAQAPAIAQRIAADACIVGVIGPVFSGEALVAMPIFERAGLTTITASATNPTLTQSGWRRFHRSIATDTMLADAAGRYLTKTLNAPAVAILDDGSDYGSGLSNAVAATVNRATTGRVRLRESVAATTTDFSAVLERIKASGATAVFYGGYYDGGGRLLAAIRRAGISAAFLGGDGLLDPGFRSAAGSSGVTAGSTIFATTAPTTGYVRSADFASAYRSAFAVAPGPYGVEYYDAAGFLLKAIDYSNVTRDDVHGYVAYATYQGSAKDLRFDRLGEVATASVFAYQYDAQGAVSVTLVP